MTHHMSTLLSDIRQTLTENVKKKKGYAVLSTDHRKLKEFLLRNDHEALESAIISAEAVGGSVSELLTDGTLGESVWEPSSAD